MLRRAIGPSRNLLGGTLSCFALSRCSFLALAWFACFAIAAAYFATRAACRSSEVVRGRSPEAVFFLFLPLCQFLEVLVRIGNPIFRHNQSGLDPFLVKEFLSRGSSHRHGGRWIDQIAGSSPYCHNVDNASHCIYTSSPRFCHLNC
jgi:hypothetical protein